MKKALLYFAIAGLCGCASDKADKTFKPVVVNEDGTVTFYYKNDNAKSVFTDVQFAGRNPMKKDSVSGLWTVTLGPAAPDMYPYCFVVDGESVMDPKCKEFFPNEGFKNSLLEIPAKNGPLPHDIKNVPHGKIVYVNYFSKTLNAVNHAVVYLPPDFSPESDKKYPVFYLISGTTDTEEVYYKVGRANYILDNMLADKKAEEMIIVMPYGNPYKILPEVPDMAGIPQTNFGQDLFSLDLVNDLMPYVESNFPTLNDKDHRAIGGFSRGGNQGLSNGLRNLDKFSYLCSYSSFTSTDIPGVYDNTAETNSKIKLFWLGVGTDDFLYGNARDYMQFLDDKGIRSVKEYTSDKYGHTWMNAKFFLAHTFGLLFNSEKSESAMANAKPAMAATGSEPQFTPGVMARLFPKPLISPEYQEDGIVFRFKAENANEVSLVSEIGNFPMKKDTSGVWSVKISENFETPFTYFFAFDSTPVADPQNMYISPSKGFKPSVANHPKNRYSYFTAGNVKFGKTVYNLNDSSAMYIPEGLSYNGTLPVIQLLNGKNDTFESWFKCGFADLVVSKLLAENKITPCVLATGNFQGKKSAVIDADKFKTWAQRQKELEKILIEKCGK
jgi:enterochelin esterase-like enzyme